MRECVSTLNHGGALLRRDDAEPGKIEVLHEGVVVGFLRVEVHPHYVRVRYAERTAEPEGSTGAFAKAYHELMDLFGVPTVLSDVRMSEKAQGFWRRLRADPPARKYCWRNGLASEARELGELPPPEELPTAMYGTIKTALQDYEYALSKAEAYQASHAEDECDVAWVWQAPEGVIDRLNDCELLDIRGVSGLAARALAVADEGRETGKQVKVTAEGPTHPVHLPLPGAVYREFVSRPEAERQQLFTGWVIAGLDLWDELFDGGD